MEEEEDDIEIEVEERRKSFDDKEMDLPAEKEKEIEQVHEMPVAVEKKDPDFTDLKMKDSDHLPQTQDQVEEEEEILFETQSRMQHVVDLVMWRDTSKSAFVFGSGSFFLLSSSYVKDLNFSLLSAISYTGLLYLAVIFLYRSILLRGQAVELVERKEKYVVGEEEAIWVLRKVLPYLNELLFRIRALFSGDPPTTMKMAVLLFVLARCGGSITIWTLAKLAFFGVFTVPKALSSYSEQLARYGKFWLARFQDGWESCAHKKAAAAAIFTVIWNLSSTIARIWAVFMLVVIMRVYQQHVTEEWQGEEVAEDEKQTQKVEVAIEEPSLSRQCWRRSGSCKGSACLRDGR
ncbi:Reticulon-like protein B21 [Apostasia shenzhenica]|uniref:Reticulon-like protein n=1 Tax=Apostasia shenzhenica TaxID=1088818 RepID=A0A2I0B7Y6_9ASPA|nr:Reticulon-like protein B21 [Apostasia shenzhenica]